MNYSQLIISIGVHSLEAAVSSCEAREWHSSSCPHEGCAVRVEKFGILEG